MSPPAATRFATQYGPWAIVAGASEGLGAEYSRQIAAKGLNVALVARREGLLNDLADRIRGAYGTEVRVIPMDLATPHLAEQLSRATADLDIGLLVYNAAYAITAPYGEVSLEKHLQMVDVNVRGPLTLTHAFSQRMTERGRGGIVLMSSLAGLQGSPRLATYAATKSFNVILAEGLWGELRSRGVDVIVTCAGAVRTPGVGISVSKDPPGALTPEQIVKGTLDALGKGPRYIPGGTNRLAAFLMTRLLPRSRAVTLMASQTKGVS